MMKTGFKDLGAGGAVGRWLCWLMLALCAANAQAHLAGVTDTSIQIGASQVKVVYTLPSDSLQELPSAVDTPASPDRQQQLQHQIMAGFSISNDGISCGSSGYSVRQLQQVQSHQFSLLYDCGSALGILDIEYRLFVDRFPDHENFVRVAMGGKHISRVFAAGQNTVRLPVAETLKSWGVTLTNNFIDDPNKELNLELRPDYFSLGVEHILLGFDHLLFLFALLLLPLAFRQLVAMITAFTVAHSITLALAVFDLLNLPALWVEAVIALSIVYVGVENLLELRSANGGAGNFKTPWKRRVAVTFCFGLIHGIGFSYVLKTIGLGDQVASALLFFNLGVEAGQLLAVVLVFPLLLWVFNQRKGFWFSRIGSGLVILMGSVWLVERVITAVS